MATHAPITGAPPRAPETDDRPVSQMASGVQLLLYRIRSMAYAIDLAGNELEPTGPDGEIAAHIISFSAAIHDLVGEGVARLDTIELATQRLERAAGEGR